MSKYQPKHMLQQAPNLRITSFPLREKNDILNAKLNVHPANSSQRLLNNQRNTTSDTKTKGEKPSLYKEILDSRPQHFFLNINEIRSNNSNSNNGRTASFAKLSNENDYLDLGRGDANNNNSPFRRQRLSHTRSNRKNGSFSPLENRTSPGFEDVYDENQGYCHPETDRIGSGLDTARNDFTVNEWSGDHDAYEMLPNGRAQFSKSNGQQRGSSKKFAKVLFKESSESDAAYIKLEQSRTSSQNIKITNQNAANPEVQELKEAEIISFIKEKLQFVTECKEHKNQPLTLFNPITKQLACIQCVYHQKESGTKKSAFVSFENAFSQMAEHNKYFKLESQEKILELERQLQVCDSNVSAIKKNVDYFFTEIAKEFHELHEKLYERERLLVETLRETAENRRLQVKSRVDVLEFLKTCYQDARQVNPSSSVEQCVHFYAVFNLLKNTSKSFNLHMENLSRNNLEQAEFPGSQDLRAMIDKYGKIKSPKLSTPVASSKAQRPSVGALNSSSTKKIKLANRSFDRVLTSPIRDESLTPRKRKGSSPPNSTYLERETLRNKFKAQQRGPGQKTFDNKSQQKAQPRKSVPSSDNKLESTSRSHRNSETLDSHRVHTLLQKLRHPNVSKNELRGSKSTDRISTVNASPLRSESNGTARDRNLDEFAISLGNSRAKTHSYGAKINLSSAKSDLMRQSEYLDNITTTEFTKDTEKKYDTTSFNRESVQGLFLDSNILLDEKAKYDMVSIFCEQILETKLLYRLSQHGPSSEAFHTKCDKKAPILAIVHANRHYVFGYYMPVPFEPEDKYITCEDSFLFSLRNPELSGPLVFPVKQDKTFIAVHQSVRSPCMGSTIQNKQDLWIQLDEPNKSCSNIGYAYKLPNGIVGSVALAGQYSDWQVHEIEFYKISF